MGIIQIAYFKIMTGIKVHKKPTTKPARVCIGVWAFTPIRAIAEKQETNKTTTNNQTGFIANR